MTQLDAILDAQARQLDFDELIAEIEAENRAEAPQTGRARDQIRARAGSSVATESPEIGTGTHCEVEAHCHALLGINGGSKYPYVCGFKLAGTAHLCPRRKRLGGAK